MVSYVQKHIHTQFKKFTRIWLFLLAADLRRRLKIDFCDSD
jgi:hypothetical protein